MSNENWPAPIVFRDLEDGTVREEQVEQATAAPGEKRDIWVNDRCPTCGRKKPGRKKAANG